MQYRDYQPHTALQSHIASYFSLEVDEAKQERELVLPDGTHGLIFVQNAGFVRESSEGNAQKITGSYLFGQKTSAVYYSLDVPGLSCFGVKFQPTGIRALVGAHASELTDHVVEAEALMDYEFRAISERLTLAISDQEKSAILDSYFLSHLRDENDQAKLTNAILAEIHLQAGSIDIAKLSTKFNLSYKRIERLFQKHVGLTPKAYCRLTRFNGTLNAIGKTGWGNLTNLCYDSGYYDQMHFIREVKQYTGLTPKQLYRKKLGVLGTHQASLVSSRLVLRKAS